MWTHNVLLPGLVVALALSACRRGERSNPPKTPEEAASRTVAAARGQKTRHLFDLLDRGSRWSVMSAHEARQTICKLVRANYPRARQERELRRCRSAEEARGAEDFFASLLARHADWLEPLLGFKAPGQRSGAGKQVVLVGGGQRLQLCRGDGGWWYCGMSQALDRLKVRAARDLTAVRENIESIK